MSYTWELGCCAEMNRAVPACPLASSSLAIPANRDDKSWQSWDHSLVSADIASLKQEICCLLKMLEIQCWRPDIV